MLLQSLHDLHGRLQGDPEYRIPPPGYSLQKIAFRVVLNPDGTLFEIQDARIKDGKRMVPDQTMVLGEGKPSGSGLNPCFLWDNTGYMLGFKPDDPKPARTESTFDAFRKKHVELESKIDTPRYTAVCRFLREWTPSATVNHPILEEMTSGFGVFQIRGEASHVHDDPTIQAWWGENRDDESSVPVGQCLVSGEIASIAPTHPKIKGVMDAQGAGGSLVSFNEPAYESYGKTQSHNAPVSETATKRYTSALNALLDGPMRDKHRLLLGGSTVVFWTERASPTEDVFAQFLSGAATEVGADTDQDPVLLQKLRLFLRALRKGREAYGELETDPDRTNFFVLGLAPNAGRLSVRMFHRGTVSDLLDRIRRHHADIGLRPDPPSGKRRGDPEFPAAWLLLRQTGREPKDIPPILAGPLLDAIVSGRPYPSAMYSAVLRRIRADREITYLRCCVIKGYLVRNRKKEIAMSLDPGNQEPAYRVGRLFAALEKTQQEALPGINATIRDRFYGSASATPGAVIPRLLRTYQHHLSKLQGGRKVNREKLVQDILSPIKEFPSHLGLDGQGMFALGYYHQMKDFYTKRDDKDSR